MSKTIDHWWMRGKNNYGWQGGIRKNPLYNVWLRMYERCTNKKLSSWKRYGGRGIGFCKRWRKVKNFIDDMSPTYKTGLTLERIDNNKGYSPKNCRWATLLEQAHNQNRIPKSGYYGVYAHSGELAKYEGRKKKWNAYLRYDGKKYDAGYYETALEAAKAYDLLAVRIHGLFARLNFPQS